MLYFTHIKAYCLVIAAMILLGFFWIPLIFFGVFYLITAWRAIFFCFRLQSKY